MTELCNLLADFGFNPQLEFDAIGDHGASRNWPLESFHDQGWSVNIDAKNCEENACTLTVSCERIGAVQATGILALRITCDTWSTDNYLLMPASVYNGNRFPARSMPYPPLLTDPVNPPMDRPIITDVPRLGLDGEPSRLEQLSGDMTTPAIGIYFPKLKKGFWLLTEQANELGNYGFCIEENDDRTALTLRITTPGYRPERRYHGTGSWQESEDIPSVFSSGDCVTIRMRMVAFDGEELADLYRVFRDIRKDLTGPVQLRHDLPFSQAWQILEQKHNDENWYAEGGFFGQVVTRANNAFPWRSGWCGGLMSTWPLLVLGDENSRERVWRTLDSVLTKGMSKCGLFYSSASPDGSAWQGCPYPVEGAGKLHLIRRSGDALNYAVKQIDFLRDAGRDIPPAWMTAVESCADALVAIWHENGQFGHYVQQHTGDIVIGGSCAGSNVPGALVGCWKLLQKNNYLEVATAAGKFFREEALDNGLTTGGPGEIIQCPDSESCFNLLDSYIALYEATGDAVWLDCACRTADMALTWCMSYDYDFPVDSLFGKLGLRSAGSVWANVQNKHSAPGICTGSGLSLLKLFRATGERIYLETIQEIAHNLTQYLSRPDRSIGDLPVGWINERVNTSDWEQNVGGIFIESNWPEVSLMLTCLEIPGVYVQPDRGLVCCFDHVHAELDSTGSRLILSNPTPYDLETTLLIENDTACGQPLKNAFFASLPKIRLAAGESRMHSLGAGVQHKL